MKLFEKLFCGHKWKVHNKENRETYDFGSKQLIRERTLEILICQKCGKIKKIEY